MNEVAKANQEELEENKLGSTQWRDAQFNSDEIDLFDLFDDIMENKIWVILGFVGCLLLAGAYLFVATPTYKTQAVIKNASENDLVQLNLPQLQKIYSKTVDEAFNDAKGALLSKEMRRSFFEQNLERIKGIPNLYNPQISESQNFANFDKLFASKLSNDKKDAEIFATVEFELTDPVEAAALLNDFVAFALQNRLLDVQETLSSKVAAHVEKLEYDAMLLRERYYSEQTRRKLELAEAKTIASAIGQSSPVIAKVEIMGSYTPPLYMYGTQAISAESKAITNRKALAKNLPYGEDHFIKGLPEVLFDIQQLKGLKVDFNKVKLAVVDEKAIVPVKPIKPKKALIIALAGVAGIFMGLMAALLIAAFKRHKEKVTA